MVPRYWNILKKTNKELVVVHESPLVIWFVFPHNDGSRSKLVIWEQRIKGSIYPILTHQFFAWKRENHTTLATTREVPSIIMPHNHNKCAYLGITKTSHFHFGWIQWFCGANLSSNPIKHDFFLGSKPIFSFLIKFPLFSTKILNFFEKFYFWSVKFNFPIIWYPRV